MCTCCNRWFKLITELYKSTFANTCTSVFSLLSITRTSFIRKLITISVSVGVVAKFYLFMNTNLHQTKSVDWKINHLANKVYSVKIDVVLPKKSRITNRPVTLRSLCSVHSEQCASGALWGKSTLCELGAFRLLGFECFKITHTLLNL